MKVTESTSNHDHLETKTAMELVSAINSEDKSVADVIANELTMISRLIEGVYQKMSSGGRLFYIGAGTSGRLGILDASECPPTFGVSHGLVIGIIAGGDQAIRKAVEFSEDDLKQGWKDLCKHEISNKDFVIGISASGSTPYVLSALQTAKAHGISTGCIVCNRNSFIGSTVDYPITLVTGPEFVTGSTRMKAGTAQKMVLNMISTSIMILLGKVKGNKMIDMQLSNIKLIERGVNMILSEVEITKEEAEKLLIKHGSVRKVISMFKAE